TNQTRPARSSRGRRIVTDCPANRDPRVSSLCGTRTHSIETEALSLRSFISKSISILGAVVVAASIQACDSMMTDVGGRGVDTVRPSISAVVAASHTCALTTVGSAYCWGYSVEQPDGTDTPVVSPTLVPAPNGIAFQSLSISKVDDVTCALATTGAAYC